MDVTNVLSFMVVASLLVVSPGPNGVLIAKTVPLSGKRAGFANIAGFVSAFYLHGALSILGISAILLTSAKAFFIVKMAGAAYLCWIGIKALHDACRRVPCTPAISVASQKRTFGGAYMEGLLTNAFNPKVSMFYLAAFPQFITTGDGAVGSAFALVSLHALVNALWFAAMVMLLTRLSKFAQDGLFQRWLKGFTGIVFLGFGMRLATYRP